MTSICSRGVTKTRSLFRLGGLAGWMGCLELYSYLLYLLYVMDDYLVHYMDGLRDLACIIQSAIVLLPWDRHGHIQFS